MKIHSFHSPCGAFVRSYAAAISVVVLLVFAAPVLSQATATGTVSAQLHPVTPQLTAYAQVEPIQLVPVDAAETGVVEGLHVLPGAFVHAGQQLASLGGPAMRTMLAQSQADVQSAHVSLVAAQKSLTIQRGQLSSHLTTRQAVHQAQSAEAQAQTALENAQSQLAAVRQEMHLTATTAGTVLALNSANGQLVSAGQSILTLQPEGRLWLKATFYGADLRHLRTGMKGSFAPSDGDPAIAVRVCSIPGMLTSGGGESVSLCPAHGSAAWLNGESGTVRLDLPPQSLVAVPTRALILNQGKWWVMVHTAKGDHAQQVVPGPTQGWNTFVESGLAPGAQVIVNNAYLLFHASITEQFQIPD
jgi:RND family efflux transporter MFP subunit